MIRYGTIPVYHHGDAQNTTAYVFTYDDASTDPYTAIEQAITEIARDPDFRSLAKSEKDPWPVTMRDVFAEGPDEPFERRGVTFLPVFCEYTVDGDELIDPNEEG